MRLLLTLCLGVSLDWIWVDLYRPRFQAAEEFAQFLPDFGAAGKAFPVHANESHELVAFVDGKQVVVGGGVSTGVAEAVDEQAFDVGFHFIQNRIARDDVVPGFEREQRLGCAGRAGIERDYAVLKTAAKKKRHVDGDHQGVPLGVVEIECGSGADAAGNSLELNSLAAEEQGAGVAGAENLALCYFDQVRVIGAQAQAAHFATLERALAAGELAQCSEAVGGFRGLCCAHGLKTPNVITSLRRGE